jgi:hypothetical protein
LNNKEVAKHSDLSVPIAHLVQSKMYQILQQQNDDPNKQSSNLNFERRDIEKDDNYQIIIEIGETFNRWKVNRKDIISDSSQQEGRFRKLQVLSQILIKKYKKYQSQLPFRRECLQWKYSNQVMRQIQSTEMRNQLMDQMGKFEEDMIITYIIKYFLNCLLIRCLCKIDTENTLIALNHENLSIKKQVSDLRQKLMVLEQAKALWKYELKVYEEDTSIMVRREEQRLAKKECLLMNLRKLNIIKDAKKRKLNDEQ